MSGELPQYVIRTKDGKFRWQRSVNGGVVYSPVFTQLRELEPLFPVLDSCYKVLKRSGISPKSVRGQITTICDASRHQILGDEAIQSIFASKNGIDDRSSVDILGDSVSLVGHNDDFTEISHSESPRAWVLGNTTSTSVVPSELPSIDCLERI